MRDKRSCERKMMYNWGGGRQFRRGSVEEGETAAASRPAERRGKADKDSLPLMWGTIVPTSKKAILVGRNNQKTAMD